MLRAVFSTLRQGRYAALVAVMAILALGCVAAGTFEIHRFHEKRHDNATLTGNAHAAAVALTTALVPVVGGAPLVVGGAPLVVGGAPPVVRGSVAPPDSAILYRTVSVSGTYDVARQQYVGNQEQGGHQGFWVLTPLRTPAGTVLIVRGFVAAIEGTERRPSTVESPPTGTVRVQARLRPAQTASDRLGELGSAEIASINAVQQAARAGQPVFDAFAILRNGQPGTAGLDEVPAPDLSNPSGGAGELQLLSYVVQWYAFALLALAAPFLFSRAEVREARKRFLGIDPDAEQFDAVTGQRPVELAGAGAPAGGDLVVRGAGTLAQRSAPTQVQRRRAARLADRYGRSLGLDEDRDRDDLLASAPDAGRPVRAIGGTPGELRGMAAADSRVAPHRAVDAHHGSYNDYLWQLALSDGSAPAIGSTAADGGGGDAAASELAPPTFDLPTPRVIDATERDDAG